MKNLANIDLEQAETLPVHDRVRPPDGWRRIGRDFPRNKISRFLLSRQGKLWDDVFSEYVHLDWVPKQYRTETEISSFVYLHTFMDGGKVWFHDKYMDGARLVDDFKYGGDCFYRHPETKKLCYHHKIKIDYAKRQKEEESRTMRILGDYHQLLKIHGTWFEIKGEPVPSNIAVVGGLHYKPAGEKLDADITSRHRADYKVIDGKLYLPCDGRLAKPLGPKDCLLEIIETRRRCPWWKHKDFSSVKIKVYRQFNSKSLKKYGLKNDRKLSLGIRCKKCGGIAGDTCIYHICPICSGYYRENCKCNKF